MSRGRLQAGKRRQHRGGDESTRVKARKSSKRHSEMFASKGTGSALASGASTKRRSAAEVSNLKHWVRRSGDVLSPFI